MSTIFICDGCGKQSERRFSQYSPPDWFRKIERINLGSVVYDACSRECIEKIGKSHGTSDVALPV